ncbi:MAG TPA: hypothetical protein VD908_19475 [Cytophagales bacterium]|nr:hypothetical protein [Cytophagales bacterium]
MARVKSRNLFELIKSLNKNEKRYFKMMASASSQNEDKKILQLFEFINKSETFDEDNILKKLPALKAEQLSNLKAYLYYKILQAVRQYTGSKLLDIQIRELIDFAQLLFERRLYNQGINCLKKAKKLALTHDNLELQLEIIKLEKSVLMQTIGDDENKVDTIIQEVKKINTQINNINIFSNLSIKLNSYYTKIGFIRGENDFIQVREFFFSNIPDTKEEALSIIEKIYLYKLYIGYYFFIQDLENGYLSSQKMVKLFEENQQIIKSHPEDYIKALNNLLIAQFKLFRFGEFEITNKKLHSIEKNHSLRINESIRIRLLKYYYMHEINRYFMMGDFDKGVELITVQIPEIEELIGGLDKHSALILNYKIACLYVGASNYRQSVKWLNKIINISNADIREDLHCFARIINLICHYELGNFDVINYYIISTYRFLLKKDDLYLFQKSILNFLKDLNKEAGNTELVERFANLKRQLLPLVNSTFEKRAFIYFDIISWLESKIENRPVQEVIRDKFLKRVKT